MKIDIQTTQQQTLTCAQAETFVNAHIGGVRHNLDEPVGGYPAPFPLEGTDNHLPTAIQMTDGIYTDTRSKLLSAGVTTIQGTEYVRILEPNVLEEMLKPENNFDTDGDGKLSISEMAAITSISQFKNNKNITEFMLLKYLTGLSYITFQGCSNLKKLDFENMRFISTNCFEGCTSLPTAVKFDNVTRVDQFAFNLDSGGTKSSARALFFPKLNSLTGYTFRHGSFTFFDLGTCASISDYAFYGNGAPVVLRSKTPPSISTSTGNNQFSIIYVDEDALDLYLSKSEWTGRTSKIFKIGGAEWAAAFGSSDKYADYTYYGLTPPNEE